MRTEVSARKQRERARVSLLEFLRYVWWQPHELIIGQHTRAICAAIDKAITAFISGLSTYLDIAVPYRHGKSDIVSRALPAYFLARTCSMNPDVIMTGYGADLVEGFSQDTKALIQSERYGELFPDVSLARGRNRADKWGIDGNTGKVIATGLGGSLTGHGAHLLIVDDYCKSKEEARSEAHRRQTWNAFATDAMSRLAPVHIVIVCATPWHEDDIRGRMRKKMADDENFPQFKQLKFPAKIKDDAGNWTGDYLFQERFPASWYQAQYSVQGQFASGLLDCEPTLEGGNRFKTVQGVNIHVHDTADDFPTGRYMRVWDLASSEKQRTKDDPDYTVGTLGTVTVDKETIGGTEFRRASIWIKHIAYCQSEAPARDRLILQAAKDDGSGIPICVEAFGAYKDAYATLRHILRGVRTVHKSRMLGDKSAKAAPLEPIFEAGNIHIVKAGWNDLFFKHFREFPEGAHDDVVDTVAILYHEFEGKSRSTFI